MLIPIKKKLKYKITTRIENPQNTVVYMCVCVKC